MPEVKPKDTFDRWIVSFNILRIQGFLNQKESSSCYKRIVKAINAAGYTVEHVGFHEWRYNKIDALDK